MAHLQCSSNFWNQVRPARPYKESEIQGGGIPRAVAMVVMLEITIALNVH